MKKLVILIAVVFASCNTTPVADNAETSHRIIGKEYNVYSGYGFVIIEVDGIEYISMSSGGICPLVKDTLKK